VPDDAAPAALSGLWAARAVAVVGATERRGSPGRQVLEHLLRFGYAGRILPINTRAPDTVLGLTAYPSVRASGAEVDLAVIVVPADAVPAAVEDCAGAGVRVAIVGSSGFAETGAEGRKRQDEITAIARRAGMRLVGPNCIGSVGLHSGLVASFSPLFAGEHTELIAGNIGFASASGALGYGAVSLALERGLGLYAAVTTGNEADVTTLEVLTALAGEPGCTAVLGYLESLSDGPALRALAATGKPTVLLVAGRSAAGARAAVSHTGVLATADRIVDGVLRQFGLVRVSDVDELLDVGDAFAAGRLPSGPRVAVVTTSGGSGILAADAVEAAGLRLAELEPSTVEALGEIVPSYGSVANPVDVTATVMRDRTLVARCLEAVAADRGVDIVVVCFCVLVGDDAEAIVAALAEAVRRFGKPILVARTGADHLAPAAGRTLRAAGIPAYPTPARAVRAAAALRQVARPQVARPQVARREMSGAAQPTEADLKALLAEHGIPVPRGRVTGTAGDARRAVADVGGRAVLKVVVPGTVHKTELGGVALDVTAERAEAIATRLLGIPGATGVLVEEQVEPGVELLLGVASSPLGRILTIGAGGVLTEVLDDAAVRLLPVTAVDVRLALAETRVHRLLNGFRGSPPADAAAFVRLATAVAEFAGQLPDGVALDLNPVVVTAHGATVLDAAWIAGEG
jgi:acyl-CoA synthetase (NDP forming)